MKSARRRYLSSIFLWVLLAPFFLLCLISPATMPARAADGSFTLVLCTAEGPVTLAIDPATGAPAQESPSGTADSCDWACGHAVVVDLIRPEVPAPALHVRRVAPPLATVTIVQAGVTGLPLATGPPAVL